MKMASQTVCGNASSNLNLLWSEFMQGAFRESDTVRKSKIVFLPFIDLPPTELNYCIFSIKFICETVARN